MNFRNKLSEALGNIVDPFLSIKYNCQLHLYYGDGVLLHEITCPTTITHLGLLNDTLFNPQIAPFFKLKSRPESENPLDDMENCDDGSFLLVSVAFRHNLNGENLVYCFFQFKIINGVISNLEEISRRHAKQYFVEGQTISSMELRDAIIALQNEMRNYAI